MNDGHSPEARAEGLAAAARVRRSELIALADAVAAGPSVSVTTPPAAATVMVEVDTRVGAFCLAELVITTAAVRVADEPGWGCVVGWDAEGALAAALCEAGRRAEADQLGAAALAQEAADRQRLVESVSATKVRFG